MNAGAAPAAAPLRPRTYKRFVTSAFHTRFVHAALLSLFVCWDLSVVLTPSYDLLWSWFPLGPAGLRAILYFISTVFIFILQVATVSVGEPTSTSPFQQVRQSIFSISTVKTGIWYILSAFWFSQVYIWSSSDMNFVIRGDGSTLDRLDERPIYFEAFFFMLAVVQTIKHVYFAQSTLQLPVVGPSNPQDKDKDQRTHPLPDTFTFFKSQGRQILLRSIAGSVFVTLLGPFVYSGLFLRQLSWRLHLILAKTFFFNIARSSHRPVGIPPIFGTMPTTAWVGFCLSVTWELSALSLITFFKKAPIKDGKPWTSAGKDPNGSLLNGLKAKQGIIKTFAFWELAIIAQNHPDRRKVIFCDIDRPSGPVWSQMLAEALKVLRGIDNRIQPPAPPATQAQQPAPTLPKILKNPGQAASSSQESTLAAQRAAKDARARQRLLDIADEKLKLLGSNHEPILAIEMPQTSTLIGRAKSYLGWFFSSSESAQINAAVLGSPHSDAATIVDAIEAVTRMLITSLQDDAYGKAMAGVPEAVRQFTKTIGVIESVAQQNLASNQLKHVQTVHARLKSGLAELLAAFQMFLSDSGLGISDLNAAKKASGQLAAEEKEQKRIQEASIQRKAQLELQDAPAREELPAESWREWSKPAKTTKLFPQYEAANLRPRRQVSGSRRQANGTARPREMEQVK